MNRRENIADRQFRIDRFLTRFGTGYREKIVADALAETLRENVLLGKVP